MNPARAATKCVACDTPTVLLAATGYCGTDDESIPCPFAVPPAVPTEERQGPEIANEEN